MDTTTVAAVVRLVGNAQALLIANLAHGLAQCAGVQPEVLAAVMDHQDLRHEDPRAEVLAVAMRKAALTALRNCTTPVGRA